MVNVRVIGSAFVVATLTFFFQSCGNHAEPEWNPTPVPDTEFCDAACSHIGPKSDANPTALDCEEGKPIELKPGACSEPVQGADCVSCEKFCVDTQTNGVWLSPRCVVNVTSCDQIDTCQEVKR